MNSANANRRIQFPSRWLLAHWGGFWWGGVLSTGPPRAKSRLQVPLSWPDLVWSIFFRRASCAVSSCNHVNILPKPDSRDADYGRGDLGSKGTCSWGAPELSPRGLILRGLFSRADVVLTAGRRMRIPSIYINR